MNSNNSSWVGKLVFFVGPTVILYAIAMYIMNRREVMRLTKTERQDANMYVWPVARRVFCISLSHLGLYLSPIKTKDYSHERITRNEHILVD